MQLTVLSIAYPLAPVGPDALGGAEQILTRMDHALTASGHRSIVVACDGSTVTGDLYSFPLPRQPFDQAAQMRCRKDVQAAIDRALKEHAVDIIHLHGFDAEVWELPAEIPVVITLHLPVSWYSSTLWQKYADRAHFCFVSDSQWRTCDIRLRSASVIQNGVPLPPFDPLFKRGDFALTLGRICPEKNAHAALEAGTLAGTTVLIGGAVFPYPEHQRYFRDRIQPLITARDLSAPCHVFLGALSRQRTQRLLARAKCLLHPTLAPETSSLVAMEALAAGTPVIAYRSGALPEIVNDGVTGFLVQNVDEMAAALRFIHTISPLACRLAARERFSLKRMISGYFNLYHGIAAGETMEDTCLAA